MSGPGWRVRAELVSWRRTRGTIIVVDLRSAVEIRLDGAAVEIWDHLVTGCELDTLVELVTHKFDVAEATASEDIVAFIRELVTRGLVSPWPDPPRRAAEPSKR